jgi:AMMECR1 domain-containing protein
VTLYEKGEVRASVGQLQEELPLGRAVIDVGGAAASQDPQHPLTAAELADVHVEVTLVGALHPVRELTDLDLARDGLYLEAPGHTGLLLPDRGAPASLDAALQALADKANLPRAQWPAGALSSFEVRVVAEPGAQLAAPVAAASPDGGP